MAGAVFHFSMRLAFFDIALEGSIAGTPYSRCLSEVCSFISKMLSGNNELVVLHNSSDPSSEEVMQLDDTTMVYRP